MAALVVATVGKTRRGPLADLEADYLARIARLSPVKRECVGASRAATRDERRREEGAALAACIAPRGTSVALDMHGRALSSEQFRERLAQWRARGPVTFVIGGPDGLDDAALAACGERLALGPMTLPHELALVVLLEQLFRALAAETNHPYTKH